MENETLKLRLMTTTGPFRTLAQHDCATVDDARKLVEAHAAAHRITNVKLMDDGTEGWRFTGTTAGGRPGRNIAFLD